MPLTYNDKEIIGTESWKFTTGKRCATSRMTPKFILALLTNGEHNYKIENGIPEDAEIVGVTIFQGRDVEITFESEGLPENVLLLKPIVSIKTKGGK